MSADALHNSKFLFAASARPRSASEQFVAVTGYSGVDREDSSWAEAGEWVEGPFDLGLKAFKKCGTCCGLLHNQPSPISRDPVAHISASRLRYCEGCSMRRVPVVPPRFAAPSIPTVADGLHVRSGTEDQPARAGVLPATDLRRALLRRRIDRHEKPLTVRCHCVLLRSTARGGARAPGHHASMSNWGRRAAARSHRSSSSRES